MSKGTINRHSSFNAFKLVLLLDKEQFFWLCVFDSQGVLYFFYYSKGKLNEIISFDGFWKLKTVLYFTEINRNLTDTNENGVSLVIKSYRIVW